MSDEKEDWEQRFNHKWRQGVRDPNGDTYYPMGEHGAPQLEDCTDKVKDFIADEIAIAIIRGRAEEIAKYNILLEALSMAFKEADFLPANRFVRKTLSIFEPVRAALKTLERR